MFLACVNASDVKLTQSRAIWWVKRDMRLADNEALTAALQQHDSVIALFVCEPSVYNAQDTSAMHVFAWWQALRELQSALRAIGGELYFAKGEVVPVLQHLHEQTPFDAIYSHQETGNALTFERDKNVKRWAESALVQWHEKTQNGVVRGLEDRDLRSDIIQCRLFSTEPVPAPASMRTFTVSCDDIVSTTWHDYASLCSQPVDECIRFNQMQRVGEVDAQRELTHFLDERVSDYSRGISSPNTAFQTGSRLSVHLAWGTISARTVFYESQLRIGYWQSSASPDAGYWTKNLQAFQSRLHWRDHFTQRLESASYMEHRALNPVFEQMAYEDEHALLQAWVDGKTGIPLIDACMRCLRATGFLNFRMRAMLVTTACFGLRLSWRTVQYPLARVFYDYEPGIHFSQIQMQAGIVGINTMRVYSPHKQLLDQDPNCEFIKRWIPELAEFSSETIANYNHVPLGDYPAPVDDIVVNSADIKAQISKIKKSEEAVEPTAEVLAKHGSRLHATNRRKKKPRPEHQDADSPQMNLPL